MPVALSPQTTEVSLLAIIDFKWLMATHGQGVHVERMQTDPAYARECLLRGTRSATPMLRDTAHRLAHAMGIGLAAGGPGG